MTPDREDMEPAEDGGMDMAMDDKMVVAFPHEHHYALAQEFLHVVGGASEVTLIDLTVQSGAALFGVTLCNGRAAGVLCWIGCCKCKLILSPVFGSCGKPVCVRSLQDGRPQELGDG